MIVVALMITSYTDPTEIGAQRLTKVFTQPENHHDSQPTPWIENVDQHCTVFYAANDQVALGGNNEDGYHPVLTRIWFVPPEEGRFGMALVGFDNFGNPEGAINDQGLFFDGLAVRDVDVPLREGRQIHAGKAIMKIMSECGTVECALNFFNRYSLPGHWNGQWLIGDSHGNSAIIEPLTIVQKEGAFQVGTNFFQSEVPLADRTDARYVTATKMLSEADTFSIDLFRDTLNAFHQESNGVHTLYSTIYDLKQRLIYLYYFHDFEHVVTFDLKKELATGIHSYDIPSLFAASVARHLDELKHLDARLLNFEMVGYPEITILTSDVNGTVKNSPEMVKSTVAAAERAGVPYKVKAASFGTGTDAAAFTWAGLKATTLFPFKVPQQLVAFYHQKWDTPEVLTIEPLLNVLKLTFEWIRCG